MSPLRRSKPTIAVEVGRYRYSPDQRRQAKRHAAAAKAEGYSVYLKRLRHGQADFLNLEITRPGDSPLGLPEWDMRITPPHQIHAGGTTDSEPD